MERYLQIIKISWLTALVLSIVFTVFTALALFLIGDNAELVNEKNFLVCEIIGMVLIVIIVIFSDKLLKKRIKKLHNVDLIQKLVKYKTYYTRQVLCYVVVCIICFIMVMITKQQLCLLFDVLAILLIIARRPNSVKVKFDLNLTQEELSKFNHIKFATK